jgi:hypothetical protein
VHQRRAGLLQRQDRPGHRFAQADGWQRRRHVPADRVGRAGPPGDQGVEQVAFHHGPDHLGGHDRRLFLDHGQLGHVVLAQQRDGRADVLLRVDVDELGQAAPLPGHDVGHQRLGGLLGEEAVVGHPLVVEDLRQVAAAAVGQQHDDHRVRAGRLGHPQRGRDREPGRAAGEQRFLPGQPPGHAERLGVADRDDLIAHGRIVGGGPDVLTDALDQVGAP